MTAYYVDDGGSNTSPFDTWAKAAPSFADLIAGVAAALTTAGNVIYVGDDHVDSVTGAHRTHTGPSTSGCVAIISCDRTSGATPPAYKKGTSAQFKSDDGAYNMTLDGAFALYGVKIVSGGNITLDTVNDEPAMCDDCAFVLAANGTLSFSGTAGRRIAQNCQVDLTLDGTTARANTVVSVSNTYLYAFSFTNPGYRTGEVFVAFNRNEISGCDLSGFSNGTLCQPVNTADSFTIMSHCKLHSSAIGAPVALGSLGNNIDSRVMLVNCYTADEPTYMHYFTWLGAVASSTTVYRSGGATVEGVAVSWLVTTIASYVSVYVPFYTPWIYGVTTSGSKIFDIYIENTTADFTDADVWIELDYLATSDSGIWTRATDRAATIVTAGTNQDDDSSTWVSEDLTYKQKLSKTVTVGENGQFRARVAVGLANITSSRKFYVDPKVVVTAA